MRQCFGQSWHSTVFELEESLLARDIWFSAEDESREEGVKAYSPKLFCERENVYCSALFWEATSSCFDTGTYQRAATSPLRISSNVGSVSIFLFSANSLIWFFLMANIVYVCTSSRDECLCLSIWEAPTGIATKWTIVRYWRKFPWLYRSLKRCRRLRVFCWILMNDPSLLHIQ